MSIAARRIPVWGLLLAILTAAPLVQVPAGGLLCGHCQCSRPCNKVCRLVREDRKITTVCWGCQSEDFCVPAPATPRCEHCDIVCDDCYDKGQKVCVEPRRIVWKNWIPGCSAEVHTKHKLMKKTVTKTVPSYKWVVVDLCAECQAGTRDADIEPGATIPPKPKVDEKSK
jgi:hypothetical protein